MVCVPLVYSGILGCTACIAGAVGSHGLKSKTEEQRNAFLIGAHYQLMHSIAALGAVAFGQVVKTTSPVAAKRFTIAAWLFLAGTTLFSGTIYARTFGAPKEMGRLAPTGGYVMMGGWACLAAAAFAL
ncbi:hypothetical protein ABB37_01657 [Leptomonas pyrrhocoris]|uniref:DUF423-domain-containing protein n=1 Tax=Leptomonas pyrrhocoris TaxID=157538 RepID=A0A0N0DZI2_LEPPY|nr:hypothetical protein ABB37_01657 [Leptomonas pyrrhocoris]KPA85328.1 hypothetical protein ABB37_01657 [Leptomonas pyrrhocoris]|eukprot:XP_015663767.1 hypothetical protein ABB37_01657 [Leptomonas pyrrhocoris]